MKEKLKEFVLASWTPSEKILLVADVFLAGILIGRRGGINHDYHIERWINKRIRTADVRI